MTEVPTAARVQVPLYSPEERRRRDSSVWTPVQGVLAALQFVAFLVSVTLVARFLITGAGETAATISIVVKTGFLFAIMLTGCLWERDVFGRYLFARPFFWEDVGSIFVIALHSAYLLALLSHLGGVRAQMFIALAGYAAYILNATQFLLKLRAARLQAPRDAPATVALAVTAK